LILAAELAAADHEARDGTGVGGAQKPCQLRVVALVLLLHVAQTAADLRRSEVDLGVDELHRAHPRRHGGLRGGPQRACVSTCRPHSSSRKRSVARAACGINTFAGAAFLIIFATEFFPSFFSR
jgi:hypothetical protein